MNRIRIRETRTPQKMLAGVALLALGGGAVLAQDNGGSSDSKVEMSVVQALDQAPQLKDDLITAATIQGVVTLSGTVASSTDSHLAESIAAKVDGVAKVHNNLKVGDPKAAAVQDNLSEPSDNDQQSDQQSDQQGAVDNQAQGQYPQQGQPYSGQQGQYPEQGQYPQQGQYPAPPAGYAAVPRQPAYRPAPGPVTIPPGALLALRTSEPVVSKHAKDGEPVQFILVRDVTANGYLAIPRGAVVHGVICEVQKPERGALGGSAIVGLRLTGVELGGRLYPVSSDEFRVKGPSKTGRTIGSAFGGALLGAVIGGMAGGGTGAAIGAGVGAGGGTAASAAISGPDAWIPAEAQVDFHLAAPLTVNPVSEQEALRMSQGLYQGGPMLYSRPGYYVPQPVYYGGPVYYRPYYVMGGVYGWR